MSIFFILELVWIFVFKLMWVFLVGYGMDSMMSGMVCGTVRYGIVCGVARYVIWYVGGMV